MPGTRYGYDVAGWHSCVSVASPVVVRTHKEPPDRPASCPAVASSPGLHGASVVIMGRREKFLSKAVDQLRADGVSASFFAGDVRCTSC